jgi:hypothetical protein
MQPVEFAGEMPPVGCTNGCRRGVGSMFGFKGDLYGIGVDLAPPNDTSLTPMDRFAPHNEFDYAHKIKNSNPGHESSPKHGRRIAAAS